MEDLIRILETNKNIVGQKNRTYSLSFTGNEGASEDLIWKDDIIMRKGSKTNCVSVTTELLFRMMKDLGFEEAFTYDDMKELLEYCFIYDDKKQLWGIVDAMIDFGLGEEKDLESIGTGEIIFSQLWHIHPKISSGVGTRGSKYYLGHSTLCESIIDDTYIRTFSATQDIDGPGEKDLLIKRTFGSGHQRSWRFCNLNVSF